METILSKEEIVLTGEQEKPKLNDYGKYDMPPDKIHTTITIHKQKYYEEPFETLFSVNNKKDSESRLEKNTKTFPD